MNRAPTRRGMELSSLGTLAGTSLRRYNIEIRSGPIPIPKELHFPFIGCFYEVNEFMPVEESQLKIPVLGESANLYTRYWYIWDSLNGTLDKIGHGTWDNVYWVTKNEGTGMALKTMGH